MAAVVQISDAATARPVSKAGTIVARRLGGRRPNKNIVVYVRTYCPTTQKPQWAIRIPAALFFGLEFVLLFYCSTFEQ